MMPEVEEPMSGVGGRGGLDLGIDLVLEVEPLRHAFLTIQCASFTASAMELAKVSLPFFGRAAMVSLA